MKKLFLLFLYICILKCAISCSIDRGNISTINGANFVDVPFYFYENAKEQSDVIYYCSELTNLLCTFPKTKNKAINKEITNLKNNVNDYIYASQKNDTGAQSKALSNIENLYKNIQHLKKGSYLEKDGILNAYLVKIKRYIYILETLKNNNTPSTTKQ